MIDRNVVAVILGLVSFVCAEVNCLNGQANLELNLYKNCNCVRV
jgi:hypothetical protein